MPQCAGTTRKGERCKREAREGSAYCAIHVDAKAQARAGGSSRAESGKPRSAPWTSDDTWKAFIGLGVIAAIVLFRLRR